MGARAWLGCAATAATMLMGLPGLETAAATPAASHPARVELIVDIAMTAPCPSRIDCSHELRVESADGEDRATIGLDGPTRSDGRPVRFQVPPGKVRVTLDTMAMTGRADGLDGGSSRAIALASCVTTLALTGPGPVTVYGLVSYAPPPEGSVVDPPIDERWSCRLSDAGPPSPVAKQGIVVPLPVVVCDLGETEREYGCEQAASAARKVRRALHVAPLAVVVPSCPVGACRVPSYAVSFATDEGDPARWSEPYLVLAGPGIPVLDWPAGTPVPQALIDAQARQSRKVTGRLGAEVPLHVGPAPSGGCPEALVGWLVRHATSGLALQGADGVEDIVWPLGWTARVAREGRVLIDASGEIVAHEGELLQLDGGRDADSGVVTCGNLSLPSPS